MSNTTTFANKRAFYASLIAGAVITQEQADYAAALIDKLDDYNLKRKTSNKALAAAAEKDEFRNTVLSYVSDTMQSSGEISRAMIADGQTTASVNKVASALRDLAAAGFVIVSKEFKENGKGAKKNGYMLPPTDETAGDETAED
jgi:hypothetical protein